MGLAIEVGVTAGADGADWREPLDQLSTALAARGVVWREPHGTAAPARRPHAASFPYSYLHHLRRVLALVDTGAPVPPVDGPHGLDADKDVVEEETVMFSSHLLCHSDAEGYYVPVAFDDPVLLPEDAGVAGGGMVGSSQGLLAELRRCAPAIGVQLAADGSLPDAEAERLVRLPDTADFAIETTVWLTLHEACQASIRSGCAIVFI